jgi:hypothetical protein
MAQLGKRLVQAWVSPRDADALAELARTRGITLAALVRRLIQGAIYQRQTELARGRRKQPS